MIERIPKTETEMNGIMGKFFPKRKFDFVVQIGQLQAIGVIDANETFHVFMPANLLDHKEQAEKYLKSEGFNDLEALQLNETVDTNEEYANE